jgi:flagellar operon protein (TIGR03826 family)
MPDVRNCRKCGKIFNYIGGQPICPVCKQLDEDDFKKVKEYLYKNPGATVSQISTELDISVEKIKRFLKEGRLEIIGDDGNMILECESCGKAIKTGRFCHECEKALASNLKTAASQMSSSLSHTEGTDRSNNLKYLHKNDIKPRQE